jgi:Flp pilus assembly pilin Flp
MSYIQHRLFATVGRLVIEQEGAAASEYAIILGVIVVVVVAASVVFGLQFSSTTSAVYSGLSNSADSAGGSFGPGDFRSQTSVAFP